MFDFINESKFLSLRKNNEELQREVASLKKQLDDALAVIKDVNSSIRKGPFAFDFDNVNTFSIERNVNNNMPVTIIGYFLPEPREDGSVKDMVREWYFYCDEEQHIKLVTQFEAAQKNSVQHTKNVV